MPELSESKCFSFSAGKDGLPAFDFHFTVHEKKYFSRWSKNEMLRSYQNETLRAVQKGFLRVFGGGFGLAS